MFMTRQFLAIGVTALLAGTTAHALTADQVWQGWQANATGLGLSLTADPATTTGGTLALRNLQLSADNQVIFRLSDMTLTETAEGAVTIGLPPTFDLSPPPNEGQTLTLNVAQTGLAITVSEPAPDTRQYAYEAEKLQVTGEYVEMIDTFDGGALQPDSFAFDFNIDGLTGSYSDTPGTNRSFVAALAARTFAYDINNTGPFVGQSLQSSTAQDVVINGTVTLPATFDLMAMENPGQMADALRDGLAVSVNFAQGAGTSDQTESSEFFSFGVKLTGDGSEFQMTFDKSGFLMAGTSKPMTATITSPGMPFPQLDLALGASAVEFKFPVIGPEVQDFRTMIRLDSIAMNDAAWAALDPTAVLARTPFVLDIDVTGRTSLDIFGLMQSDEDGTMPPIPVVERADIVRLLVSAAGAEVSGTGAFTFDNSLGFPMPRGNADFTVKGANKMIDALITLGVITSDDAMGARMAMALILEPTAEPDVMTSRIEAREDGGFYVNGQRMH